MGGLKNPETGRTYISDPNIQDYTVHVSDINVQILDYIVHVSDIQYTCTNIRLWYVHLIYRTYTRLYCTCI